MSELEWATVCLVVVTFILVCLTTWNICVNKNLQEKMFKERLLTEIIDWACEVSITSNTREYFIIVGKSAYIIGIANGKFEKDLSEIVRITVNTLVKKLYLSVEPERKNEVDTKLSEDKNTFNRISELKLEIENGTETLGQLYEKYSRELANSIEILISKASLIKAKLF